MSEEAMEQYGIPLIADPAKGSYDAVLLAVPHCTYVERGGPLLRAFGTKDAVFYDLKSVFGAAESDLRL
jgi:UDP-N-acetyl-D-galactosamine dehydrogenase